MDFIGSIFEKIEYLWDYIKPFWIVEQYNGAVQLRVGKFLRVLEPGIHWKLPCWDAVIEHTIVPTTMRLFSQSLVTKDEKSIVVQGVIKYQISDIKTFLLGVNDAVDAIADMSQGIIKGIIMERTWEECKSPEIDNIITKKARVEAKKWGIDIIQVTLSDMGTIRSIRLFQNAYTTPLM